MNPLLKRLATLRLKVRLLDGWQGICAIVALVLGVGVTVGVIDFWVHLPNLVRALTLIGLLVGSAVVAYRYLIKPLASSCDDLTLALRVEEKYPELNDALASTVQFLSQPKGEQERVGGSASMRDRTIQETLDKADKCDFGRILDRRGAALFGAAAVGVLLVAGLVIGLNRQYAGIAALRLIEPFGQHTWTRIAVARRPAELIDPAADWPALEVDKKDVVAIGRPYFIKVSLEGQIPAQAKVEVRRQQGKIRSADKLVPLQVNPKDKTASFVTPIDMTQQHQKFEFRILANDGAFPPRSNSWHEVEVLPPPELAELEGKRSPQIKVFPPGYSDLPTPEILTPGTGHLDVFEGSNIVLRAKANRPLVQAWIEYRPENALLAPAAMLSPIGPTSAVQAVTQFVAGHAAWGRFPAEFEADQATFSVTFRPWISGGYVLFLRDADGLERHERYDLRVKRDPLPEVKLVRPVGSSQTARPDSVIPFKFRVTDEQFAIRSVYVKYQRKAGDGTPVGPQERIVLYEAKHHGAMIPFWLSQIGLPARSSVEPRLRRKQLDFETAWSLQYENADGKKINRFKEGDLVVVEVCADDFCDVHLTREAGRSHTIELRIIGPDQMVRENQRNVNDIHKKVKEIAAIQKKAFDTIKEIKQLDKIDAKALDRLIEAEQQQKEVQSMIGKTPDEGLRRDLADLQRSLKENKLDKTDVAQQASKMKGALDQIAQQELPQIEPRLVEARNDLTQDGKKTPKTDKNLGETSKLQEKVLKGLDELNTDLARFAGMQDLRDNLRDVIQNQSDLANSVEQMKSDKAENVRENPEKAKQIEEDFRKALDRKAQEQRELAQKMEKMIEQLKAARDEHEKKGDKENARKIDDAIKKAEGKDAPMPKQAEDKKPPISSQMKDVAKELQNKNDVPQQTLDKANEIVKNLDQMMDALDGKKDTTQQEINDRKQMQKKLDDLARKADDLKKQTQKTAQIKDMEERLKEEKKLVEQHDRLQEEIEKTARELARLQEQEAAAKMNQAAENIAKAKQQLGQGEDPGQQQQEAKDNIQQAKDDVKMAQDELAREALVKIHDQLKAYRDRQESLNDRVGRFEEKFLKRKAWSDAFLDTMETNIDAQKGIADESGTLKEKIKEAKVFSSILERARESMDKAGEVMTTRRDEGKDRRKPDPTEKLTPEELKDEAEWHADTVTHQKQALARLDRLLEVLKEELKKPKTPKKKDDVAKKDPDEKPKDPPQRPRGNPDGIPGMAELKLLKAEQEDLLERTKDFARRNPDTKNLNEPQRRELHNLEVEQERLQSLFQEITARAPQLKEGEMP